MRKRTGWILIGALIGSLLANAYLFDRAHKWPEARTEQILTTAVVEHLYKNSNADVSYEAVKELVGRELGQYEEVRANEAGLEWPEPSARVLVVDGTRLIFKDGRYVGSKADLRAGLEHWRGSGPF